MRAVCNFKYRGAFQKFLPAKECPERHKTLLILASSSSTYASTFLILVATIKLNNLLNIDRNSLNLSLNLSLRELILALLPRLDCYVSAL